MGVAYRNEAKKCAVMRVGKRRGFAATVGECIRSSSSNMLNLNMCEVLVVGRYLISKYVLLVIEDFSFLLCGECLECVVSHVWKKKKRIEWRGS